MEGGREGSGGKEEREGGMGVGRGEGSGEREAGDGGKKGKDPSLPAPTLSLQ